MKYGSFNDMPEVNDVLALAERNDTNAQVLLGFYYAEGMGVTKNIDRAVYWFKKAAEAGNSDGQTKLGILLLNERGDTGAAEAVQWLQKAVAAGEREAMFALGSCYIEGTGVVENVPRGFELLQKAAVLGDPGAIATLRQVGWM